MTCARFVRSSRWDQFQHAGSSLHAKARAFEYKKNNYTMLRRDMTASSRKWWDGLVTGRAMQAAGSDSAVEEHDMSFVPFPRINPDTRAHLTPVNGFITHDCSGEI